MKRKRGSQRKPKNEKKSKVKHADPQDEEMPTKTAASHSDRQMQSDGSLTTAKLEAAEDTELSDVCTTTKMYAATIYMNPLELEVLERNRYIIRHLLNLNYTNTDLISTIKLVEKPLQILINFNKMEQCCTVQSEYEEMVNYVSDNIGKLLFYKKFSSTKRGLTAWCSSAECLRRLEEINFLHNTASTVLLCKAAPYGSPSAVPSVTPYESPSDVPSATPYESPSDVPSVTPYESPSDVPSVTPYGSPSAVPSASSTKKETTSTFHQNGSSVSPSISLMYRLSLFKLDVGDLQVDGVVSCSHEVASLVKQLFWCKKLKIGLHQCYQQTNRRRVHIFHGTQENWKEDTRMIEHIEKTIKAGLTLMQHLKIIAIPTLSQEDLECSCIDAAKAIVFSVLDFLSSPPQCQIQRILLVVPHTDDTMYQAFEYTLKGIKQEAEENEEVEVLVKFAGLDIQSLHNAANQFECYAAEALTAANWANSPLRSTLESISKSEITRFHTMARRRHVDVRFLSRAGTTTYTDIYLEGLPADVEFLKERITYHLISLSPMQDNLPAHWVKDMYEHEIILDPGSSEFQCVQNKFFKQQQYNIKILEIARIQNKDLYLQYQAYKARVRRECDKLKLYHGDVEQEVWHGTSKAVAKSVCKKEFNRSFSQSVNYGHGIYFSPKPSVSVLYSRNYLGFNQCMDLYIILVKAVTGKPMQGAHLLTSKNLAKRKCHSTRSTLLNPDEIVLFNDAAAYPEYVIKYQMS